MNNSCPNDSRKTRRWVPFPLSKLYHLVLVLIVQRGTSGTTFHCLKQLPAEHPNNPNRIWKGRVLKAWMGMHFLLDCCRVVSLEPGYEELTELVLISQIVSVE